MFAPLTAKSLSKTSVPAGRALLDQSTFARRLDIGTERTDRRSSSPEGQDRDSRPSIGGADFARISLYPAGRAAEAAPSAAPPPDRTIPLQKKLKVGAVDDPLEREADRVAEQVTRMPASGPLTFATPQISRKCAACEAEERLQRRSAVPDVGGGEVPDIVLDALRSPGESLNAITRADFELRFGADLGRVRVHAGALAERSAQAINAHAYTVGNDIVFGRGRFAPHFGDGRRLLAHELAHVIQQTGSTPRVQRDVQPLTASTDLSAIQTRLDAIIRTGGPLPSDQTRVIGAAIVEIPGYTGPTEIRAISGAATDVLGQNAPVHHATTPDARTLSATRSIGGSSVRREFPFSHINDAEIKIFEEIAAHTPAGAKGRIHFTTMRNRVRSGVSTLEPIPACSGCNRAAFELSGGLPGIEVVTHAAAHPTGSHEMGSGGGGALHEGSEHTTGGAHEEHGASSSATSGETRGVSVTESIGAPIEAPHVTSGHAVHAAAEFGAIAILGAQLDAVRGAEKDKAVKRLNELSPEIEDYRRRGEGVTVTLVVEVPDQVDIAAIWAGIGDPSQVVYFRKMYISNVTKAASAPSAWSAPQRTAISANDAPGDPDAFDPHELPLEAQIRMQMGEKYPIPKLGPLKGFHFASRDLFLPAYPTAAAAEPGARGLPGRYRPVSVKLYSNGDPMHVKTYGLGRSLLVSTGQFSSIDTTMIDTNDGRPYSETGVRFALGESPRSFSRTYEKNPGTRDNYRIGCTFSYVATKDFDVLIEEASGEDLNPGWNLNSKWRATLIWVKM